MIAKKTPNKTRHRKEGAPPLKNQMADLQSGTKPYGGRSMGRKNELGYDVIHIPVERPVGLPVVPHTKQYKFLENKGRLGPVIGSPF